MGSPNHQSRDPMILRVGHLELGPHCTRPTWLQDGPVTSYIRAHNSTYRGYNPNYPFIRPLFIGVITSFATSRGPSCTKITKHDS